jgi:hypothetical protein
VVMDRWLMDSFVVFRMWMDRSRFKPRVLNRGLLFLLIALFLFTLTLETLCAEFLRSFSRRYH